MSYRVTVVDDVVVLEVEGEWDYPIALAAQGEVGAIAREQGLVKILVDLSRCALLPSAADVYEFTKSHFAAFPHQARHAVVVSGEGLRDANVRFSETVAANFGVTLRLFAARDEAFDWLRQGPSS